MKRCETIKDKKKFNSIIRSGTFCKNRYYVLYYSESLDKKFSKFGVAIKKSYGKAVERNKIKRQTRNIIDKYKKEFKKGKDYIIMIRNECLNADFKKLDESLEALVKGIK